MGFRTHEPWPYGPTDLRPTAYGQCIIIYLPIRPFSHLVICSFNLWPSDSRINLNMAYSDCLEGNIKAVNEFINQRQDYDWCHSWNDSLYYACSGGHLDIIKLLIEKTGANDWNRGFCSACFYGYLEIMQFMIDKGVNDWDGGFINAQFNNNNNRLQVISTIFKFSRVENQVHKYYVFMRNPNGSRYNSQEIVELLYLKTPLDVFKHIKGFQELKSLVLAAGQNIRNTNVLLPDLLNIVAQCIII